MLVFLKFYLGINLNPMRENSLVKEISLSLLFLKKKRKKNLLRVSAHLRSVCDATGAQRFRRYDAIIIFSEQSLPPVFTIGIHHRVAIARALSGEN